MKAHVLENQRECCQCRAQAVGGKVEESGEAPVDDTEYQTEDEAHESDRFDYRCQQLNERIVGNDEEAGHSIAWIEQHSPMPPENIRQTAVPPVALAAEYLCRLGHFGP